MLKLNVVKSAADIHVGKEWKDVEPAKNQVEYEGRTYRVVSEKERSLPGATRAGRGFLGFLAVIFTGGLALISKKVRELFTDKKETIRFIALIDKSGDKDKNKMEAGAAGVDALKSKTSTEAPNADKAKTKDETKKTDESKKTDGAKGSDAVAKKKKAVDPSRPLPSKFPSERIWLSSPYARFLGPNTQLPPKIAETLQANMPAVLNRQSNDAVTVHKAKSIVFELKEIPGLIFKTVVDLENRGEIKKRMEAIDNARKVIAQENLHLLEIPKSRLIHVAGQDVIVEEKVNINTNESAQEQYYESCATELNETVRQLAKFIALTGFSDVEWGNIPIMNGYNDDEGNRSVALIDIEAGDSHPSTGLSKLVMCVTPEQGQIVAAVAKEHGLHFTLHEDLIKSRKEHIDANIQLQKFYEAHDIVYGDEPVQLDKKKLNFSKYGEHKALLEEQAEALVKFINERTAKSSPDASVKGRRYMLVNTNQAPFLSKYGIVPGPYSTVAAQQAGNSMGIVVQNLIDQGIIQRIVKTTGQGFFIQA